MPLYNTPTNLFVSGHANPVQWQSFGLSIPFTLNVTESSWAEEIATLIVTHSGSGGVAARLANVLDGTGDVKADFDLLVPPYLGVPNVTPGTSGLYLFYISPLKPPFSVPTIIQKVNWTTAVMGKVSYGFTIQMNSIVGQYARPGT